MNYARRHDPLHNPRDAAANIAVLLGALSTHSSSPARTQHVGFPQRIGVS
jgi:hypothetical protein